MNDSLKKIKSLHKNPLVLGIWVQLLIIFIALSIGVLRPVSKDDPSFKASPSSNSTASPIEAAKERMSAYEKLQPSSDAWEESLSDALDLAMEMPTLDPSAINFPAESLIPSHQLFTNEFQGLEHIDVSADFSDMESRVDFMGLETNAKKILFAIDVSASVKNKVDRSGVGMDSLRNEVRESLNDFGVGQLFNIVQFSRKWSFFADSFVPGTQKVKTAANDWLDNQFRTNGSSGRSWDQTNAGDGFLELLKTVFERFPDIDLLVLVSDADFQSTRPGGGYFNIDWNAIIQTTNDFQSTRPINLTINAVTFSLESDIRPKIQQWISAYGGELLEFKEK